jgi:hypothetical protein
MLELHGAGYIKLSEKKFNPHNPLAKSAKLSKATIDKTR